MGGKTLPHVGRQALQLRFGDLDPASIERFHHAAFQEPALGRIHPERVGVVNRAGGI